MYELKIEVTKGNADMIEITTISQLFAIAKKFTPEQLTVYLGTLRKSIEHYQSTYQTTESDDLEIKSWEFGFHKNKN